MEIYEMDRSEAEYFIENQILEGEKEALKFFDEIGNLSGIDDEILEVSSNSDDSDEESRNDSADDSSIKISQQNITSKINEGLFEMEMMIDLRYITDYSIEEEDENRILEREKEELSVQPNDCPYDDKNMHSRSVNANIQNDKNNFDSAVHNNERSQKKKLKKLSEAQISLQQEIEALKSNICANTELEKSCLLTLFENQRTIVAETLRAERMYEQEIKALKSNICANTEQKKKITASLRNFEEDNLNLKRNVSFLKGELSAMKHKLNAEKGAKEQVQRELFGAQVVIKDLEKKLNEDARCENTLRLQNEFKSITNDLKSSHQKVVLKLSEKMDELQKDLNEKESEKVKLISSKTELEKKLSSIEKSFRDEIKKYLLCVTTLAECITDKGKKIEEQEVLIKKLEQQLQHFKLT